MWGWVLDHWWAVTAVPYFAFNIWMLLAFERDVGDSGWLWRVIIPTVGIWIILAIVLWTVGEQVAFTVEYMYYRIVYGRRISWRFVWATVWRAVFWTSALFGFYVVSLVTTDYHPTNFERIAMLILIPGCSIVIAYNHIKERYL